MNKTNSKAFERGIAAFAKTHTSEQAAAFRAAAEPSVLGGRMQSLATEFVFGALWADDQLDGRSRSLVTMGILIAQRAVEEFGNHVRVGLANGLTPREIEETITHAAGYVGFPAAHAAMNVAATIFADGKSADPSAPAH